MSKVNINILAVVCVFMIMLTGQAVAVTRYVSPGQSIQTAIDNANNGDEIEVAPGTYYEAINFNNREVRLYSRDGNDVTIIDGTGYDHVVQCISGEDNSTILEGFTITGGDANGLSSNDMYGGGMYNYISSPTVIDCTFGGNSADSGGGGMYNYQSSPTVTNCTFSGNTAYNGGGMDNYQSSPAVTKCTFISNTTDYGGGMFNYSGSPMVTNCTFNGNMATNNGGGMGNNNSSPEVTNCAFSSNEAEWGGGIDNDESSPTVTDCTFTSNTTYAGGGMSNYLGSNPTVTNCTFNGNQAEWGGGIDNEQSSPTVINCTFSGNMVDYGGGVDNYNNSNPTIINCTFSDNAASVDGGGICNDLSNPTVTNCILWGDTPDEIYNFSGTPAVTYSDVQGGWTGTGNIDKDPRFKDVDLRLAYNSPCIDVGDNTVVTEPNDLDGGDRIVDGDCNDTEIVDMGAYEFASAYIIGDFDGECDVDFGDFAIFALAWLTEEGDDDYNSICDISLPADNYIDWRDLEVFVDNWLAGTEP